MRRACRREAAHWTRTAGWLTDEGLAVVWEQMDHLVKAGRFDDAPGLLRVVVRRAYAGEAAAAQTGVGSPTTRGLIAAIRSSAASPDRADRCRGLARRRRRTRRRWWRRRGCGRWPRCSRLQGWRWPVPPLHAVMASAAGVARSGRRCRSVMAAHHTGVPAATWSALDLLTFGSGPGCQPESRTPGVSVQIDLLGAAGIRGNPELMRIVARRCPVGRSAPAGNHRRRRHDCRRGRGRRDRLGRRAAWRVWIRMPMSGSGACPRPARSR